MSVEFPVWVVLLNNSGKKELSTFWASSLIRFDCSACCQPLLHRAHLPASVRGTELYWEYYLIGEVAHRHLSGSFSKLHTWMRFAKVNIYSLETCAFSLVCAFIFFLLSCFSFLVVFLVRGNLICLTLWPFREIRAIQCYTELYNHMLL